MSLLEEGFADSVAPRGGAGPPTAHPLREQRGERWGEGSVAAGTVCVKPFPAVHAVALPGAIPAR